MANEDLTVIIDGKKVHFTEGQTVLSVANANNIYIPTLCHIPELTPFGSCRLCMVKIEGMKGFPTACSTPVSQDMVIVTKDEEIQELRREVLKLIMSEHPYSCLICDNKDQCEELRPSKDKWGRKFGCFSCPNKETCEIRAIAEFLELKEVPYELKYKNLPLDNDDPFIEIDYNLCIVCGRCVRICNELRGSGAINFLYRGNEGRVSTAYDLLHLDTNCQFCGACVDICPTGVISSKNMKWVKKLKNYQTSICGFCSVGCGFDYYSIDKKLMESIPNKDNPVNKGQACVIGRFCTPPFVNGSTRLRYPLVRTEKDLIPTDWNNVYAEIVANLKKYKPNEIAIMVSRDLSNEAAYILKRFASNILKTDNIFTEYEEDTIDTLYTLFKDNFNVPFLSRSFQDIPQSEWILLINTNIENSHPMLQVYLKMAKDNGSTIISLNIGDPEFTFALKRLINHELSVTKEEMRGVFLLIAEILMELGGDQIKSTPNFTQFKSIFDVMIIPANIREYKTIIQSFVEKGNGTILLGHITPLPDDYKADLIGLLLNLIILNQNKIQLIPLWQHGNTEGVYQTSLFSNKSSKKIMKEIEAGKIKALYLTERIENLDLLKNVEFLVIQDIFPSDNFQFANVVLPACTFIEDSGTLINSELRLQKFEKSADGVGISKPDWEIFCDLIKEFKASNPAEFQFSDSRDILASIKKTNPFFKAIEEDRSHSIPKETHFYIPSLKYSALKIASNPFNLGSFKYRGERIANQVADLNKLVNFRKLKKSGLLKLEEERTKKPGYKIIKNEEIAPNIYELIVEAPLIAKKARPGNFILIMKDEESERLPMTLSNWDATNGTITIYYQERGYSTKELTEMPSGEKLHAVVGPLGNNIKIENFGTILLGGGCYGIGGIYPIAKEAKAKGNTVIVILEARNKMLFYLENEFEEIADKVIYCTSDGSKGFKGKIETGIKEVLKEYPQIDWSYFIGCKQMMRDASITTKKLGPIPTFVSLNTIMIDGTGMCGGCRLTLLQEGEEITKFACVDGPSFDGHLVNWDELVGRSMAFDTDEIIIYQNHFCKMLEKYKTETP